MGKTKRHPISSVHTKTSLKKYDETLRVAKPAVKELQTQSNKYLEEVGLDAGKYTKHRKGKIVQKTDVELAAKTINYTSRVAPSSVSYPQPRKMSEKQLKAMKESRERKAKEKEAAAQKAEKEAIAQKKKADKAAQKANEAKGKSKEAKKQVKEIETKLASKDKTKTKKSTSKKGKNFSDASKSKKKASTSAASPLQINSITLTDIKNEQQQRKKVFGKGNKDIRNKLEHTYWKMDYEGKKERSSKMKSNIQLQDIKKTKWAVIQTEKERIQSDEYIKKKTKDLENINYSSPEVKKNVNEIWKTAVKEYKLEDERGDLLHKKRNDTTLTKEDKRALNQRVKEIDDERKRIIAQQKLDEKNLKEKSYARKLNKPNPTKRIYGKDRTKEQRYIKYISRVEQLKEDGKERQAKRIKKVKKPSFNAINKERKKLNKPIMKETEYDWL